jgi:DNA-binding MarR family transcriptional regulator
MNTTIRGLRSRSRILAVLAAADSGPRPSVSDIAALVDLAPSTVQKHIDVLVVEGHIRRRAGRARSLVLA